MNIRKLLSIYKNIEKDPYNCLMDIGVTDLTTKFKLQDDKLLWLTDTTKAIRICKNPNSTYSVKVIDGFGPKSRHEARYTKEYYGPYQYESSAYRACIEIAKKYL